MRQEMVISHLMTASEEISSCLISFERGYLQNRLSCFYWSFNVWILSLKFASRHAGLAD